MDSLENYLNNQLVEKKKLNNRYSLRAFAKQLDLEPSHLSKIIRKKYKLTTNLINDIGQKLGLDDAQINLYIQANNKFVEAQKFSDLDAVVLSEIAQWQTFVLLRSLDINPKLDEEELASKLNLDSTTFKNLLNKLMQLKLIEKTTNGLFRRTEHQYLLRPIAENELLNKKLVKEFIFKSQESVDKNPTNQRTHMTQVISMNKKNYSKIQEKIHAFALEINRLAHEDDGQENAVMIMNINFFPVIN